MGDQATEGMQNVLGAVYKGRPPERGEGGFKIVDENGHGGRGGSDRMDVHISGFFKI